MSDTTTVRLPPELKKKLELAARRQARGKSWIIQRALDEYLTRNQPDSQQTEAQRQCKAANSADRKDRGWEQFADWPA